MNAEPRRQGFSRFQWVVLAVTTAAMAACGWAASSAKDQEYAVKLKMAALLFPVLGLILVAMGFRVAEASERDSEEGKKEALRALGDVSKLVIWVIVVLSWIVLVFLALMIWGLRGV